MYLHRLPARRRVPALAALCAAFLFALLWILLPGAHTARAVEPLAAESPAGASATSAGALITPTYWTPPNPAYKIGVKVDGLHVLSYSALQNAGLPVDTLDPRTLRVFYMGREIAIEVEGQADGRLDPTDVLLFYGRSVDSLYFEGRLPDHKYTGTNIFWLTYGGPVGLRMATRSAAPSGTAAGPFLFTHRLEQQLRYVTQYPSYDSAPTYNPADDHWFWYKLQMIGSPGTKTQNINFTASNPATGALTGGVKVKVVGASSGVHGLRLYLNNTLIFENSTDWKNFEPYTAVASVPQSLFASSNTLRVEMYNIGTTTISENYIDWAELTYYRTHAAVANTLTFDGEAGPGPWRYALTGFTAADVQLYDVSDLFAVTRLTNPTVGGSSPFTVDFGDSAGGRRYFALASAARIAPAAADIQPVQHQASAHTPSGLWVARNGAGGYSLLDADNGADWIVITHRAFWNEIMPLADYRAGKYRVAVVDVQEIYDQFNGGLISSEAIRDFLLYARANWEAPAPQFLLLAGGGTSDIRQYLVSSKPTYVPPYLYPSDPILGVTAADNRYVTLVGNDLLPDMHIGRFPAYAAAEITTMVSKTISYESTPTYNDWNTNVLFIADDLEGGGGNFYHFSDVLIDGSADPLDPENTKFLPSPYQPTRVYLGQTCDLTNPSTATECRAAIVDMINNQGALLVSYIGHAQIRNWALEKLLDPTVASSLTNIDKLSIIVAMTCFEGFFHEPPNGSRSLAETYLINPNGGAVASYSPTGFGVATGHDWLEQGLFLALFQDDIHVLGAAVTASKYYLHDNAPQSKYDDLIDTMMLMGDPALQVQAFIEPTAVEVTGLAAEAAGDGVHLAWQTLDESGMAAFHVQWSEDADGPFAAITAEPIPALSAGMSAGNAYTYHDATARAGWYRLQVLRLDGSQSTIGPVSVTSAVQRVFLPVVTR